MDVLCSKLTISQYNSKHFLASSSPRFIDLKLQVYISDLNQERVAQAGLFGAEKCIPDAVKVDAIVEVCKDEDVTTYIKTCFHKITGLIVTCFFPF